MWPAGAEHPMGTGQGHGPAAPSLAGSSAMAWQSPVPYLFGGLAATLGLIALSLLALACSHWKLYGGSLLPAGEPGDDGGGLERQAGDGKDAGERVLVIMAGDEMPTFLATPALGRGGGGSEDGEGGRCAECGARS